MAEAAASVPRRPNLLTPTCSATYVAALAQHAGQSGIHDMYEHVRKLTCPGNV